MPEYLQVPSWSTYQHYRNRSPGWIKLYLQLWDNYEFSSMPDATKAHLVGIWRIAATTDNKIPKDPDWIAQRVGATDPVDLDMLIEREFLEPWSSEDRAADKEARYIPKAVRMAVMDRDHGLCQVCGSDDKIEVAKHKQDAAPELENIFLICRPCNRRRRATK